MNYLITGGTGDIGQILLKKINQKENITVFARQSSNQELITKYGAKTHIGDLKDPNSLYRAAYNKEIIFHIGEISLKDPHFLTGNLETIKTLIQAIKNQPKFQRLIFISSICVACHPQSLPATENTPTSFHMNDKHTHMKRLTEQILLDSNIPVTILRLPFVYGPNIHYWTKLIKLIKNFHKVRLPLPFPEGGTKLMPFIHCDDLIRLMLEGINENDKHPTIYNVTDDQPESLQTFFHLLSQKLNYPLRLTSIPYKYAKIISTTMDTLLLSKHSNIFSWTHFLSNDLIFSNTKLKKRFQNLTYPSLQNGIDSMAQWLLKTQPFPKKEHI